ncbi:MAG: hypothetical protein ACN23H_01210 [Candidatus Phytoplasma vitis]|nr:MAG: hypothetical protein M6G77_01085 [Candidatus Phytoplasma vitis]
MKEINQDDLITKIKFAQLSKKEELIIKLAFQIDENNKFSQKLIPLNNQEIADYINKKNSNINYSIRKVEIKKNQALKKLRDLYQPKEEAIAETPTTIYFEEE